MTLFYAELVPEFGECDEALKLAFFIENVDCCEREMATASWRKIRRWMPDNESTIEPVIAKDEQIQRMIISY